MAFVTWIRIIEVLAVVCSGTCVVAASIHPSSEGQKLAALVSFFMFLCCLGIYGGTITSDVPLMIFANKIKYVGVCNIFSVFAVLYAGFMEVRIPRWFTHLMFTWGAVLTFFTSTIDYNKFFYTSYYAVLINGVPTLVKIYGPMHTVCMMTIAAYLVGYIGMYIYSKRKAPQKQGVFSLFLCIMVMIPVVSYLTGKIFHTGWDLLPLGMLVCALFLIYAIFSKFYDANTVALETVFENSEDAIIVENSFHEFEQANKKAKGMFPFLKRMMPGNPIEEKMCCIGYTVEELKQNPDRTHLFATGGEQYSVSYRSLIMGKHRENAGYVFILKNITMEREHESLLEKYKNDLEQEVRVKTGQLVKTQENMMIGFASLVESKNSVTGAHIKRTSEYAKAIARQLMKQEAYADEIDEEYVNRLCRVAPLHDIGKIAIPEEILNKPGKLTPQEFAIMKTHTTEGGRVINMVMKEGCDRNDRIIAKQIALFHHEKWDGSGYPDGRSKTEIPLCARIMAVADVFDALVSKRPYKEAFSFEESMEIMENECGRQFDPTVWKAFQKIQDEVEQIYRQTKEEETDGGNDR